MPRSKEEAINAGVTIKETRHIMKRRKPWHDYHRKGTYMLTLVVEGRLPVLGKLVIPASLPAPTPASLPAATPASLPATTPASLPATTPASLSATTPASLSATTPAASAAGSFIELTPLGMTIRDEEAQKISAIYKMVEVWKLCIMPDHIHMIVRVTEDLPEGKHLGDVVRGFKVGCTRAWQRLTTPASLPATTPASPLATTPAASAAGIAPSAASPSLFESGYNDLILLGDGQLDNWKHYLDDNPRRLAVKRLCPDYFTTLNYADIAEWHCQLVGNSFLLDIPQKVAVIVHSGYSDEEYAYHRERWLACGEAGGILVSAAIARREKEVMREAMNRGYRLILARENGFPPLYKPSGESFDACSDGRLLQVSPWQYHMERRTISREQCLILNRLVEEIVKGDRRAKET